MNINQVFGNNLKKYRYMRGLTQEKLSELANISTTYVSQLENGEHAPSFENLSNICEALDIEEYQLFVRCKTGKALPSRVDTYLKKTE